MTAQVIRRWWVALVVALAWCLARAPAALSDTPIQGQTLGPGGYLVRVGVDDGGLLILSPQSNLNVQVTLGDSGVIIEPGAAFITGGDGGIPAKPIIADLPTQVCCGLTPTPIPYTQAISCQNLGVEVVVYADAGGNIIGQDVSSGTLGSPGGVVAIGPALGPQYLCEAVGGTAQTANDAGRVMFGCLSCDQVKQ